MDRNPILTGPLSSPLSLLPFFPPFLSLPSNLSNGGGEPQPLHSPPRLRAAAAAASRHCHRPRRSRSAPIRTQSSGPNSLRRSESSESLRVYRGPRWVRGARTQHHRPVPQPHSERRGFLRVAEDRHLLAYRGGSACAVRPGFDGRVLDNPSRVVRVEG